MEHRYTDYFISEDKIQKEIALAITLARVYKPVRKLAVVQVFSVIGIIEYADLEKHENVLFVTI